MNGDRAWKAFSCLMLTPLKLFLSGWQTKRKPQPPKAPKRGVKGHELWARIVQWRVPKPAGSIKGAENPCLAQLWQDLLYRGHRVMTLFAIWFSCYHHTRHQGVGSDTGAMISIDCNLSSSYLSTAFRATSTFLGVWTTSTAFSSISRWYGSSNFPVPSKTSADSTALIDFFVWHCEAKWFSFCHEAHFFPRAGHSC